MTQADPIPIWRRIDFIREVLQQTGYSSEDILSLSISDRIIMMRNGGKYRLADGEIEHLAGPSPDPSERM
jgi:hypothetical protein